jgi:hypothetical protein
VNLLELSQNELSQGWHVQGDNLHCNYCPFSLAQSEPAAKPHLATHLLTVHQSNLQALLDLDIKYNNLTAKQKELLVAFASGKKDQVIAEETGTADSTVRHQKFTFREKAKQAKYYLAVYENAFKTSHATEKLLPVPLRAGNVDDRFAITEEEYQHVLNNYFDFSSECPKLIKWPKQQKTIVALLHRVIEEINVGASYNEKQITTLLRQIYLDPVMLRRYLIEYGFLSRTNDGSRYWRET